MLQMKSQTKHHSMYANKNKFIRNNINEFISSKPNINTKECRIIENFYEKHVKRCIEKS